MHKNIAVLMGGYGSEVHISINSGKTVMEALDTKVYAAYAVHILADRWVCVFEDEEFHINKRDFSVMLPFGQVFFDACYNTIHGAPGENGELQAYLKAIGVPQTSCNFYESALTFNKKDTLSVLRPYDVPMAQSIYVNSRDKDVYAFAKSRIGDSRPKGERSDKSQLQKNNFSYPVFVKPNRAGSSYGVSKVYNEETLEEALDKAFKEDHEVLIESFLSGTEVSVGVYNVGEGIEVLPVCEIVPDGDFFDLEAKYSGKSQEIVPARLSKVQTKAVQDLTARVYKILNLKGICRVDFIFHNNIPHFVEVNTNPGLSSESIIPRQIKAAGWGLTEIFGQAIEACLKN